MKQVPWGEFPADLPAWVGIQRRGRRGGYTYKIVVVAKDSSVWCERGRLIKRLHDAEIFIKHNEAMHDYVGLLKDTWPPVVPPPTLLEP